jgi:hypothetical protein
MKRRALGAMGVIACGLAVGGATSAIADQGVGGCHAHLLQSYKQQAGTTSGEATADSFGVQVQLGQALIRLQCGQS